MADRSRFAKRRVPCRVVILAVRPMPGRDRQHEGEPDMEREPIPGECVVIARHNGRYSGAVGQRYVVVDVDESDSTIRGIPQGSRAVGDQWIPWSDIEPVSFGWHYARQHLPREIVTLLDACDGAEHLAMNRQVKLAIVESLPDWKDRVLTAIEHLDAM